MTVTKLDKNDPEEKEEKMVGHNEDIYNKVQNNLNVQKEEEKKTVETKFKMKDEDDEEIFCLPLKIRSKNQELSIRNRSEEEEEEFQVTHMVAKMKISSTNDEENDNDDTKRESEEEEEVEYLERGPMMGGRLPRQNRNHPYDPNAAVSPSSSSSSFFDSESSNSSPDTSPRHSISIAIPSRPHYGSVGLVTVVPPSEQNRGAEGESPSHDFNGRKRHSLKHLSGGGLVVPEEQAVAASSASPKPSYPFVTISGIPADSILDKSQFVADTFTLPVPSPYATYRDTLSHSPLSVQSLSDESLALASPASDLGQSSPLGLDFQEQFLCSSLALEVDTSSQPFIFHGEAIENSGETQSFLAPSIEDLVSNLLDEFDYPDKRTDFAGITLCDSIDPVMASLSSSTSSKPYAVQSESHHFPTLEPSLPPPQRRVQRSPPIDSNVLSNPRSRRNSKQDVKEEIDKIMKSFPKILPKLDPPLTSSSSSKPQLVSATHPSPPLLPISTQAPVFNALVKMRSLISDHARNAAIVSMEKLTIEELCSGDRYDGDTYLHIAVGEENFPYIYAIVKLLDEKKRSIDIDNSLRQTPLFVSVVGNNPTIVEYLLHYGANPDCVCRDGTTPLQIVATRGDAMYDVAKLLCDTKRVDFRRRNRQGLNALQLAVQNHGNNVNCIRIVQLFLQSGASLTEQESCTGKTALHLAVEKGCVEMVRTLCENSSDVALAINAKTYVDDMPLHLAAMSRNVDEEKQLSLVTILLSHGANPSLRNKDRKLPRDLVSSNRYGVIQILNFKCNLYKSPAV